MFRADPGLVTNILSSHIHEGVSRHLPEPDVDLISEDARTLPCHASVLAAASPLLARVLRRPIIQDRVVTIYANFSVFIIQTEYFTTEFMIRDNPDFRRRRLGSG